MATTFTVLTSAFNDGSTDTPAAARAQYYTNWTQINKITDEGTADSVVKTDSNGNINLKNTISGYTTTATAGGTTTLTVSSTHTQRFTGTSSQTVKLPVTSTLSLNQEYEIVNESTGVLTVQSSGSNDITMVSSQERVVVKCIALTGTTATSWTYSKTSKDGNTTTHTQYTSIDELPAGSLDGNITDWSYEGLTLVNSIENGDFSDGTTGWTVNNASQSVTSNINTVTVSSSSADGIYQGMSSSIVGDTFFFFAKIYSDSITNFRIGFPDNFISFSDFDTGIWYEIYTKIARTGASPLILYNGNGENLDTFKIDGNTGVFAINMTALSIESYTEAQMLDLVRGGYFESIKNVENPILSTKCKNLFNKSTVTYGYQVDNTDGTDTVSTGETASDYIKIEENLDYYISGCSGTPNTDGAYYDSQKTYISGFTSYGALTIPASTVYIRFTVDEDDLDTAQLENNTSATTYEKFKSSKLQAECELARLSNGTVDSIEMTNGEAIETKRISDLTSIATATEVNTTNFTDALDGGSYLVLQDDGVIMTGTVGDTETTSDAGDVIYELATPITTNLTSELKASGLLQSYEDGTMYLQSGYKKAHIAVSNDITLDSALSEIRSIKELDETGNEINVLTTDDYDAFTAGDTTITNLPSATATYLVEGLLMYNITGAFEGEIPTNTGARIDSAIQGTNTNSKSISNLNDAVQLIIASL